MYNQTGLYQTNDPSAISCEVESSNTLRELSNAPVLIKKILPEEKKKKPINIGLQGLCVSLMPSSLSCPSSNSSKALLVHQ